jgi:hypothetical protein
MWVVPEKLAQQVGAGKLEDAVVNGLPDSGDDDAVSNDK